MVLKKLIEPFHSSFVAGVTLLVIHAAISGWLMFDIWKERDRAISEISSFAEQRSQFVGTLFSDTFITVDYVLEDIADHVQLSLEKSVPPTHLENHLQKKISSITQLQDLVILDKNCSFRVVARRKDFLGMKSRQSLCSVKHHQAGQSVYRQYIPAYRSLNGEPAILITRVIASKDGAMLAAVMAVIELEYAQKWIEKFTIGPGDSYTIIDSEGIVIARNPLAPLYLGRKLERIPGQNFLNTPSGESTFLSESPFDGIERIYGLSHQKQFGFTTIVGYEKFYALRAWRLHAWQFWFGHFVLVMASFALLRVYLCSIEQRRALNILANKDELTGIFNRRHLFSEGEKEVSRAIRYAKPLSILMMDIDLFKTINDRWGHPTGDRVIRRTADLIRGVLRNVDVYGRIGGEEFCAVLPETDLSSALAVAERLRLLVESTESAQSVRGEAIHYSISIGVSTLIPGDSSLEDVMVRADRALYQAKESGRNRSVAG